MAIPFLSDISGKSATLSGDLTVSGNLILSGASNEIIKSNGSIRLNIDSDANETDRIFVVSKHSNSELFRIQEDGKVGINISNPNEKLHVEGTSRFNGDIHIGSSASGIIYRPVESGSAIDRYFLMFDETNNASFPFLTNRTPSGDVAIKTGTAAGSAENEHFRIKGGDGVVDAYFTNVKLGIGEDDPDELLHLKTAEATIKFESTHGRHSLINQGGGNFHIKAVHGSGVGINYGDTTNPGLLRLYNNTTAKITLNASAGTIASGAITALAKGTQLGTSGYYINSTFKDGDANAAGENVGVFLAHNDTNNGTGAIAGINQLAFLTYGSAWTQALLLDTNQNATFAGNITANTGTSHSFLTGNTNNLSTADTTGFRLHQSSYTDGRYTHRFRKRDMSGGVPLYLDFSSGTANVFTNLMRFGKYSGENIDVEVNGKLKATHFHGDGSNLTNVTASNCDTVDNLHAADFLRSNATDTASGKLTFTYSLSNLNSVGGNQGVTPFKSSFQATNRPGGGNYFTGIEYTFSDTGARGQLGFGSDGQNTVPHIYARTERWGQTDAWQSWYRLYHTGYHPEADQWTTARTVTFSGGDVTGNFSIDGSGDVSNVNLQVADDSHYHDSRYYTETEIDAKFTSSNGSEDEWKFTLGDESNLTGNKWYKVATINQGSGGLHIKGSFSNHVESFGTQHIDLLLQGREGNDGDEIEINGTVNVIHNAGTGTDKVGIRVIEADTSTSQYYHYYDVYMRTTRYTQAKFHLTKFGTTGFHTSKPSVTSEPAPASGGSVELDTSTLASGNHVIVDSAVKSTIADSTGYVGLGVDPTSNQRLTLAEADANGSHIKMNNSRSGGGYWVVGVGDTNSSSGIVDPGGLFFYNGTTRLKFSSAGHATFANNVTITGDLQVNGTTTTVNQTNLDVSDNIIGLNRGISSNSNDSGLIIERGSTGNNAAMIWDEANDRFVFGLTTSTASATGSVSISATSNLAARDLDVNNITSGRILATASGTGIHQLVNGSTNSTVLQLITTGDNPDLALNLQSDHIYNTGSALHIQNNDQPLYLKGSNTTVGTTTAQSGYELTVSNGPGKSISAAGEIYAPTVEIGSALLFSASTTSATTTTTISSVAKATYNVAFFDYSIKNGTNVRAGTVVAAHDGTNVEFNETSTVDLGDTSDVTLSVDISGNDMRLRATTTSSTWTIKSFIRAL